MIYNGSQIPLSRVSNVNIFEQQELLKKQSKGMGSKDSSRIR